ncbi:MAG: hypothetical protein ACK5E6_14050 [Cyanobacteriota bacterium]
MALTLLACAEAGRRWWPRLEPAHSRPLLPPWPWQRLQARGIGGPAPLARLTPGWRAQALGTPAALRYRACWQSLSRTPWDLVVFDGRLVVGLGNAANEGATANAGPVPVLAYDLQRGHWQQEATLPEE